MDLFEGIAAFFGIDAPSGLEMVFLACAVLGAGFFIIMMGLMLVGDIFGGIVDSAFDTDYSMDADLAFELFSLQGISAAIMMFGLAGMFGISATNNDLAAVLIGTTAAVGSMYAVRSMMRGINSLQADGTMNMKHAVGSTGQVYLRIKPNQVGEVQVTIEGTLRTVAARAKDDTAHLDTNSMITVVDVIGSTLIVEPLNRKQNTEEE
ncbi:MAG: NfeD family protein [Candidatus Poseidoniaceae archaeon]|jgi:membrane protein implicated in regulation of membrane protease activity|nr:NfeD family protein [Candidatus Poseidoniaceae archaeon]